VINRALVGGCGLGAAGAGSGRWGEEGMWLGDGGGGGGGRWGELNMMDG
jgi:hypothetical protein